jgi:hypothetical protein
MKLPLSRGESASGAGGVPFGKNQPVSDRDIPLHLFQMEEGLVFM